MVHRVVKLIHQEFSGLHQAAFLLAFSSFLSQLLALMRDRLFVSYFGTGPALDIYYTSFKIPDIIFASIASFVSVTVLIPFLIHKIDEGDTAGARQFMGSVMAIFCSVILVVLLIVFFIAPALCRLIAPGFHGQALADLILLTRIMLLSPFLLGLSGLFGSITQTYKRFFVYALSPILYNLGIISGIIFLYPIFGLKGLAYGVVLGAFLHLMIQLPSVYRIGLWPSLKTKINWSEIRQVIMISLPRTLALATDKIVIAVLVAMASYLAAGSITIFNLAFNLQSVPLAIVAVSYSTAAFPTLSQMLKRGEKKEFIDKIATALRHIIFWSMPATIFFIVLRAQIVRVILGAKKFSWTDTRVAAATLALFTVSLIAQGLVLLFVRAYYAGGKTFKPLIINAGTSVLAIIFAVVFKQLFEHWPLFHFFFLSLLRVDNVAIATVLMFAWAYSLNNLVNAWLLWINFERDFGFLPTNVIRSLFECFSASVIGGFFAYLVLSLTGRLFSLNSFLAVFVQGFVAGIVGLIVWYLVLRAIGNAELREIYNQLHSRIWRNRQIIAGENV